MSSQTLMTPPPSLPRPRRLSISLRPRIPLQLQIPQSSASSSSTAVQYTRGRGRSPAPRGRVVPMPPVNLMVEEENDEFESSPDNAGDDLIFPMSPVLSDATLDSTTTTPLHHFHYPIDSRVNRFILDLKSFSNSNKPSNSTLKETEEKENNPLLPTPAKPISIPSSKHHHHQQKTLKPKKSFQIPFFRRLPPQLTTTTTALPASTPTAITVHLSSRRNTASSIYMEETTTTVSASSKPIRVTPAKPAVYRGASVDLHEEEVKGFTPKLRKKVSQLSLKGRLYGPPVPPPSKQFS